MPGPLSQATISGQVIRIINPYNTNSNRGTPSAASNNTGVTANSDNTRTNTNPAEEEETMILSNLNYNHMKGNTTNAGYRSAIRWYDIYKATDSNLLAQYPSLDDLTPPTDDAERAELISIMKGFADYLVIHARKHGTDVHLDPGTGKGYFRNVLGYLKSIPKWTEYNTPQWHKDCANNIGKALLTIQATNGDLVNTKTAKETKIGRKVFKAVIFESFKKASPRQEAKTWSMW